MKRIFLVAILLLVISQQALAGSGIYARPEERGFGIYILEPEKIESFEIGFEVVSDPFQEVSIATIAFESSLNWRLEVSREGNSFLMAGAGSPAVFHNKMLLGGFLPVEYEGFLSVNFTRGQINEREVMTFGMPRISFERPMFIHQREEGVDLFYPNSEGITPVAKAGTAFLIEGGVPPYSLEYSPFGDYEGDWSQDPYNFSGDRIEFTERLYEGKEDPLLLSEAALSIIVSDSNGKRIQVLFTVVPVYGDPTGDGLIRIDDAIFILQGIVDPNFTFSEFEKVAGDVTGNGSVSPFDAAKILQVVAGLLDLKVFPLAKGAPSRKRETFSSIFADLKRSGEIEEEVLNDLLWAYRGKLPITWGGVKR